MACLVQSISHTPLWCLLLTMLIIPLSICRPSPSIIFPQIAVLLTREQFLKSLQTLFSFSLQLPPFWSRADLALSPGWLTLPCCLPSAKVPLLWSLSHAICSSARLMRLGCPGPQHVEQKMCCPMLAACRVCAPHSLLWVRTAGSLQLSPAHKEETSRLFASYTISAWCQTHLPVQLNANQGLFFRLNFLPQARTRSRAWSTPTGEMEPSHIRMQTLCPAFIWLLWTGRTNSACLEERRTRLCPTGPSEWPQG